MKVLVTGFDPFGKDHINPSWEAVKQLPHRIKDADIIKLQIPTIAYLSLDCIKKAVMIHNPDVILSVGLAKGRKGITVERVAINVNDFSIMDNAGNTFINTAIYQDGADGYFSNLPIYAMVQHIRTIGIEASISNTAGTFICNHVMYGTRYLFPYKKSGFIHVPACEQEHDIPYMNVDDICKALIAAIEAICANDAVDLKSEGSIF